MKYKPLIAALALSVGLLGSCKKEVKVSDDPVPSRAGQVSLEEKTETLKKKGENKNIIVKEYKGTEYEITDISMISMYSNYLCAQVKKRKKGAKSVRVIFEDKGHITSFSLDSEVWMFDGLLHEKDGKVNDFKIGGAWYRRPYSGEKTNCLWRYSGESSCQEVMKLSGKIQKLFDKYVFLLKDIYVRKRAEIENKSMVGLDEL